jgi:hypothetical protein
MHEDKGALRASPAVPQYLPYPHKIDILGTTMFFFLAPAISQYLSFFRWPLIFSSSPLKEKRRYNRK